MMKRDNGFAFYWGSVVVMSAICCNEDRPNYLSRQSSHSKQDTNYGLNTTLLQSSVKQEGSLFSRFSYHANQHTHTNTDDSVCTTVVMLLSTGINCPKAEIMQHDSTRCPSDLCFCLSYHPFHYFNLSQLRMSLEHCYYCVLSKKKPH